MVVQGRQGDGLVSAEKQTISVDIHVPSPLAKRFQNLISAAAGPVASWRRQETDRISINMQSISFLVRPQQSSASRRKQVLKSFLGSDGASGWTATVMDTVKSR
jgi:hypothetical protein